MDQRTIFWMTLTDSKAQNELENNILDDTNGLQQLSMDQIAIFLDDTNGQ